MLGRYGVGFHAIALPLVFQWIGSLLPYSQTTRLEDHGQFFPSYSIVSLAAPQSSDSLWLILNDVSKQHREVFSPKLNRLETLVSEWVSLSFLSILHLHNMVLGREFTFLCRSLSHFSFYISNFGHSNCTPLKTHRKLCAVGVCLLGFS